MELEHGQIDGAYINTLVNFVNWCNCYGVKINEVFNFANGYCITFKGIEHADIICHDGSLGSPCRFGNHNNDFNAVGQWESMGFPWDDDDVSIHDSEEIAWLIANYQRKLEQK